jgi:CheY-like chemotaxis protein
VTEAVVPSTSRNLANASVLWVDDCPDNNLYERMALEALGISFVISMSTEDAVARLRSGRYDLIISDMGRPPDSQAGYTLLSRVREELKLKSPYLIYAGSNDPAHDAEARRRGASGSTGNPRDLFQRVVAILGRGG